MEPEDPARPVDTIGSMVNAKRSQAMLRLPRDQTPAVITTQDGERADVYLFVPPGENVAQVLDDPEPFVAVIYSAGVRLVARSTIACITVRETHAVADDGDLPLERQKATIRLRGGGSVQGELRWTAPPGRRRTLDHLNEPTTHLVVHGDGEASYVAKAHVASVSEEG